MSKILKMTPERFNQFPDKQRPLDSYDETTDFIKRAQERAVNSEIAQGEATWLVHGEYPNLPVGVVFMTDIHYGSTGVDYDLLNEHIKIIKETPNLFVVMGGDLVDAFAATKHPTGMMGDSIPPDEQTEAMMAMISDLDWRGKLGAVQTGNHDNRADVAGYRYERFLRELYCPVFSGAGEIHAMVGDGAERYTIYWSHTHWGKSKLNITNAAKRALQFSSDRADIALLGHTHQASAEHFDIAGKQKLAIVGGTYKQHDAWATKWGYSNPGKPGYTLILWPDEHRIEVMRDPKMARSFLLGTIREATEGKQDDPYTDLINKLNERKTKKNK